MSGRAEASGPPVRLLLADSDPSLRTVGCIGQVRVRPPAHVIVEQAGQAHLHGEQALDPSERAVGAAAEPTAIRHASATKR